MKHQLTCLVTTVIIVLSACAASAAEVTVGTFAGDVDTALASQPDEFSNRMQIAYAGSAFPAGRWQVDSISLPLIASGKMQGIDYRFDVFTTAILLDDLSPNFDSNLGSLKSHVEVLSDLPRHPLCGGRSPSLFGGGGRRLPFSAHPRESGDPGFLNRGFRGFRGCAAIGERAFGAVSAV